MSLARVTALLKSAENRRTFFNRIGRLFPETDARYIKIAAAYEVAEVAFEDVMRDAGSDRYFEHLRSVALILTDILRVRDADMIASALLHDIVEDIPEWTIERVRARFGIRVAELVWWLTKPPVSDYRSESERDLKYHRRLWEAPRDAVILKLADRLHNVCTLWGIPDERKWRKVEETAHFYLPLAIENIVLIEELEDALAELEATRNSMGLQ